MRRLLLAAALGLGTVIATALPAFAHSATLSAQCHEGVVTYTVNPDYPQEGPVKVTSLSGVVSGLAVGDTVPDSGKSFVGGSSVTVGLKWTHDNYQTTAHAGFEGQCTPVPTTTTTTTTAPPVTTTTTSIPETTTTTAPATPPVSVTSTTTAPTSTTTAPSNTPPSGLTPTPHEDHFSSCRDTQGFAFQTSLATCPGPGTAPITVVPVTQPSELPHTGAATDLLLGLGITFLALGGLFQVVGHWAWIKAKLGL